MDLRAKIKKLEALARNNPNRYEAELAAAKAREMGRELDEWDKWWNTPTVPEMTATELALRDAGRFLRKVIGDWE